MVLRSAPDQSSRMFSEYSGAILLGTPDSINKAYYICDKKFHLDPFLELQKTNDCYGIVFISGNEYEFFTLTINGDLKTVKNMKKNKIRLQKQFKNGGQSANRLQNIGENIRNGYVKIIAEEMVKTYYDKTNGKPKIESFVVVGPGSMKLDVISDPQIKQYFPNMISATLNNQIISKTDILKMYDDNRTINF